MCVVWGQEHSPQRMAREVVGGLYVFWILNPHQIQDLRVFYPIPQLPFHSGLCVQHFFKEKHLYIHRCTWEKIGEVLQN